MSSDQPTHYDPTGDELDPRVPEPAEGDTMDTGGTILGREPVMVLAVVQAILAVVVAFGLGLTGEQVGVITALAAAILGLIARNKVSPA